MNNIYDYIKYYKNNSFAEIKFNIMDALVFSLLAYIPAKNVEDGSGLAELLKSIYSVDFEEGSMKATSIQILGEIYKSRRYKNIKVFNFQKIENEKMQFGALTIRSDDFTFVSFEGTNGTIIGWKENFNLAYEYPSFTQKEAVKYLNNTIRFTDRNVYVGGHSKGGNLSMASSMECDMRVFIKIRQIYNFDGPGFRKEIFQSKKFEAMSKKLTNILPDGSIIGILLNNKNYTFVKSNGIGGDKHRPFNWHIFGQFFVEEKISTYSKNLQESINKSVDQLDKEDMKMFIDTVYEFLKINNIRTIKELKSVKMSELKKMIEQIKDVDDETKKLFISVTKILLNPIN